MTGACLCPGACVNFDVCPYPFPELDEFSFNVFTLFLDCETQWEWDSGMGFTRRTGIPNDRMMREAVVRGFYPEELFFDKFHACERVLIEWDLQRNSKSEEKENGF